MASPHPPLWRPTSLPSAPQLVLFYNFNDPEADPGYVQNLGLAGAS